MKIKFQCKMNKNGFGEMPLSKSRHIFRCKEDGIECYKCPLLEVKIKQKGE